jgi:hypothetical protein
VIEILESQSFQELRNAIQRSFGWDNGYPYSFFMSGRAWDGMTQIAFGAEGDREPPAGWPGGCGFARRTGRGGQPAWRRRVRS